MDQEPESGSGLPASSTDPNEITIVTRDDAMYLRIAQVGNAMMDFYDFVAGSNPDDEEKSQKVEAYFQKYPKTAEAKLRIAPVAFARLIPVKQQIMREDARRPLRRLSPDELKDMNLSKQQLVRLAEGEVK